MRRNRPLSGVAGRGPAEPGVLLAPGHRADRRRAAPTSGIAGSARSIRRYRHHGPAQPSSQNWRTFLASHAHVIWAADLFVVQTLTFQTLYVFFLNSHERRRLLHFDVTAHPMLESLATIRGAIATARRATATDSVGS